MRTVLLRIAACLCLASACSGQTANVARVPVTRDTWVSTVGAEADGNNGASPRLKLKSIQEMTLLDIDPEPLHGHVIKKARLHVKVAGDERLWRVTVGTVSAEWEEGAGTNYAVEPGSSTFNHRAHPDGAWSFPGSDLTSVVLGQGGSFWRMADASAPDADGWQVIPVDPNVIAARVAGMSHGFIVFDDTGSEWTRDGETWTHRLFPNRFIYSKDQNAASAPYFEVELGAKDELAPAAPEGVRWLPDWAVESGSTRVAWRTPADRGGAGTIGFVATIDGREVPRFLIPHANEPGGEVVMHVRGMNLKPRTDVVLAVRAIDGAGNVGPAAEARVRVPDPGMPDPVPELPKPFAEAAALPRVGNLSVAILDELDKIDPRTQGVIPAQDQAYFSANHLWSAKEGMIRLHAAKGEFVGFQVLLRGTAMKVELEMPGIQAGPGVRTHNLVSKYVDINTEKGGFADPLVPAAPGPTDADGATSYHVEIYVPENAAAGDYTGNLRILAGEDSFELPVTLRVWNFALPTTLSFLPEMNCYDLPANERDYYRLAHEHRTALNRVPYYHNGQVAEGCAPKWDGKTLDFTDWDRRFGPLFDASAFEGLPRQGRPTNVFYLPIFENWPVPIEPNYNGNYWADHAFTPEYRATLVEVSRQFAEHIRKRGWHATIFQFYLNGKNDFKQRGWSRSTSPWLLDEPANFQDFWALRYFAQAFHEGVGQAPGPQGWGVSLWFRADISRPQWQRESLDGLLDYAVVGSDVRRYRRLVLDRKARDGQMVLEYGGTNPIDASNYQPVAWSIDAWSMGLDGVLPWQTVGNASSWEKADELALFYPGRTPAEGSVPSIRLKAYRRGQQDVEYLIQAPKGSGKAWARALLFQQTPGQRLATGAAGEDAGRIDYGSLKPRQLWALRVMAGESVSNKVPAAAGLIQGLPPGARRDRNALAIDYMVKDR